MARVAKKQITRKKQLPAQRRDSPVSAQQFLLPWRLLRLQNEDFTEPYRQHAWVYAAIKSLARNVSQVPHLIKQGKKGGDPKAAKVLQSGPWVDLFDRVNPYMTITTLWQAVVIWLSLSGEVMIVKEGRGDQRIRPNEVPFELWPLNGRCFDPFIDPRTKLVTQWVYRPPNASPLIFQPHELVQLKYFNPYSPLRGLAPMEAAMAATRQDYKASLYNEAFFDNDASPGGLLISSDPLTPDQRRDIQEAFEDRNMGASKKHRIMVLENGLTFQATQTTHKDMEFLAQRNWDRDEILAAFGVPKSEVSLHEHLNFATAMSADRGYWTKTLIPIMRDIQEALYEKLFRAASDAETYFEFDLSTIEALRDNFDTKLQSAERLQRLGYPLNLINKRLDLGMPDVPHGNIALVPAGMIPAQELLASPESDEPDEEKPEAPPEADEPEQEEDPERARVRQAIERFVRLPGRSKREDQWKKVVEASMDPYEDRFRGKWKRWLIQLRGEQLAKVKKIEPQKSWTPAEQRDGVDDSLFDVNKAENDLKNLTLPVYGDVVSAAIIQTFDDLGGNFAFEVDDPRISKIISQRQLILAKAGPRLRNLVRAQLVEGVSAGETIAQLQERVRVVFNFSAARGLTIARTEVASATNTSRFEVMSAEGLEEHSWSTANDEAVRDSHARQDGETVAVGSKFPNGLRFPGDPEPSLPGEVINCRCVAIPVVKSAGRKVPLLEMSA